MINKMKPIDHDSKLAKLFNKYAGLNSQLIISTAPNYYSLYELNRNDVFESEYIKRVYELSFKYAVLGQSLLSIHNHTIKALELVKSYLNEFGGDAKHYATVKRVNVIREFGGEDNDYNEKGEVLFKEDNKSLESYTIYSDLCRHIQNPNTDVRGEFIGSSHPSDFELFSNVAKNANDFSPIAVLKEVYKMDIPTYTKDEEGELVKLSDIDRIEQEMNEDIQNERLVQLFNATIEKGKSISDLLEGIDPFSNELEPYTALENELNNMLNLNY